MVFLCLSEATLKMEVAYAFLDELKTQLYRKFNPQFIADRLAYGINFTSEMKTLTEEYNRHPAVNVSKEILADLAQVKDLTVDNLCTTPQRNSHE